MSKSKKLKPVTVSFAAKQAGEAQVQFPFGEENSRWAWVESSIWTDRMLTALENGVQGGKWFSLIDKVYSLANLESAATEVARNGGAAGDHQRWPNAYFVELELFSLERAHDSISQSALR